MNLYNQSQNHGFIWENNIRKNIFGLNIDNNNTNIHDISFSENKLNNNENISIKTTSSNTICCGDLLRFYSYDFSKQNTIILIKYKQLEELKIIENIFEINYNQELHNILFQNCPKSILQNYIKNTLNIPKFLKGQEAKNIYDYLVEKEKICKDYDLKININPKIDSSQTRVQCSISNFDTLLFKFIKYKSSDIEPNKIRNKFINRKIYSPKRNRNGKNKEFYLSICRENKKICKGYSKLNKTNLIELLKFKNLLIK